MDLSLCYAASVQRDRIDPEVVVPSVGWKTGKARLRINEAPAEPGEI